MNPSQHPQIQRFPTTVFTLTWDTSFDTGTLVYPTRNQAELARIETALAGAPHLADEARSLLRDDRSADLAAFIDLHKQPGHTYVIGEHHLEAFVRTDRDEPGQAPDDGHS